MKIGIIGAMEEEIVLLAAQLSEKKEWQEAGANFYSGKIGSHEVVLTRSGIGKTLAAVTATLLLSHYHVDAVINTGSAGGIGEGLAIGDLVISSKLAYFDADVTAFGYDYGQMPQMPLYYEADQTLIEKTKIVADSLSITHYTGLIVSGDTFVSSQQKITEIKEHFPKVLANEMEGAAIAQTAYQFHCPFIIIRAMSDTGDENASVNFDEFIIEAGKKSAELVLALLKKL
ncbi:5'-methylthioadenosine/adenosylhomocysteine nucleosidase [Vagococcus vulneris]|uniref:5'-methylthioadenosine/S-adenosylhomocysteine nucleosidase n=1 Tax=Vagococcus vulneris TaxID=1977869 RepID=A0A429ZX10_9ENTE|nr:5'-methylthioadenosine/adenosylhomocysteine nucleosidase [Vagococcus vulneris]RST98196.1 5'-methylthioadenosine/S-adenosylhomocysteine nucleosidase [Vagococcus vulneris]